MKYYKKAGRRISAMMVAAVLACTSMPMNVWADTGSRDDGEIEMTETLNCHHRHDEGCYEEVDASPSNATVLNCTHEHDDDCYEAKTETATDSNAAQKSETPEKPMLLDAKAGTPIQLGGYIITRDMQGVEVDEDNNIVTIDFTADNQTVFISQADSATEGGPIIVKLNWNEGCTIQLDNNITMQGTNEISPLTIINDGKDAELRLINNADEIQIIATGSHAAIALAGDARLSIESASGLGNAWNIESKAAECIGATNAFNTEVKDGAIRILGGDLTLKNTGGIGIGSKRSGCSIGEIEISGAETNVSIETTQIGIGNHYTSGGPITITDGAVVNITSTTSMGIGGYEGYVGGITIAGGAAVTVNSKTLGIGVYGDNMGPIAISDGAKVDVTSAEEGIGVGFEAIGSSISIADAEVTVSSTSAGIGGAFRSKLTQGISIDRSTIQVAVENYTGIGVDSTIDDSFVEINDSNVTLKPVKEKAYAAGICSSGGGIRINSSTVKINELSPGISLAAAHGGADDALHITNSQVDIVSKENTGITTKGEFTTTESVLISLDGGSQINIDGGTGIDSRGTLEIGDCGLDITSSRYGIMSSDPYGPITFGKQSEVTILAKESALRSYGKTDILFEGDDTARWFRSNDTAHCKVVLGNTNSQNASNNVITTRGTVTFKAGADVSIFAQKASYGNKKLIDGTVEDDYEGMLTLMGNESTDWSGHTLEIRDKDGKSLEPALICDLEHPYSIVVLRIPTAGEYTLYRDGSPVTYKPDFGNEQSIVTVKKGEPSVINVKDDAVPVTGLNLGKETMSLTKGKQSVLTYEIRPSNATNKKVTMVSDTPSVVTVNADNTLTAAALGTAKVTVTTVDGGFAKTCTITVTETTPDKKEYRLQLRGCYSQSTGGMYPAGTIVSISAGTRDGYTFNGWQSSYAGLGIANITSPNTTVVMPEADVTLTATWEKTGGNPTTPQGSSSEDKTDWVTKKYMGNGVGSDVVWTGLEDNRWTAQVNGTTPKSTWMCLNNPYARADQPKGGWFFFDESGMMKTGWHTDQDGRKFYLETKKDGIQGLMSVGWTWIDGACYYFGTGVYQDKDMLGALVTGGKTPDGYEVNAAGQWIVDGAVQTR